MTVTVTTLEPNLGKSLVKDTNADNVLTTIASPTTGSIYMVNVENPNNTAVYFKLADASSGSVGTLPADLVLKASGSAGGGVPFQANFIFPEGVRFFTGFSHWCVTAAAEASAVAPASAVTASYVIGA
tara:strand:- start:580 stop:963 length:384 start_codon:yes stop_codon:yes gene_type:complete